jgi:hypothetical protein
VAKSKKKRKKSDKELIRLDSPKIVTILVPDAIAELSNKVLHGVGRLTAVATSTFGVEEVAIVKSSQLPETIRAFSSWQKSVANE